MRGSYIHREQGKVIILVNPLPGVETNVLVVTWLLVHWSLVYWLQYRLASIPFENLFVFVALVCWLAGGWWLVGGLAGWGP